jgi:ParB/RepB/Spo0J family partition protein
MTNTLPLAQIQVSTTNPRKSFDEDKLRELTESVKADGVLQPILVRPFNGGYQLVCGERRYRAAMAAELPEIPVVIQEFDDQKVLELQLTENLQRDDLNPIEEAKGYQQLCKMHGYEIDDLAAKVHKSRAYVYGRLKLMKLPKGVKTSLLKDEISASTALLIARIPDPEIQKQAAQDILNDEEWFGNEKEVGVMSFRRAKAYIQEHYMIRLKGIPFSTTDDSLVPDAGSCTTCPHRTGNMKEFFPDIKSTDVCTHPQCFEQKKDASWERTKAQAKERGQQVLSAKQSDELFPYGTSLGYSSPYVDLKDRNFEDPKSRSWKTLLGKEGKDLLPKLVRDREGKVHEIMKKKEATAIVAKTYKFAKERQGRDDHWEASSKKHREESRITGEVERRVSAEILEQIPTFSNKAIWELIALGVVHRAWSDTLRDVGKRREIEVEKAEWGGKDYTTSFEKLIPTMSITELIGLAFEISVMPAFFAKTPAAKILKGLVDSKAINRQVRKEFSDKKKKKVAKKK